jgi:hypothetical protein
MTDANNDNPRPESGPEPKWMQRIPRLNKRRWTALLALSLIGNLLIGGLILGNRFGRDDGVRMPRDQTTQIVPRTFFRDLAPERRRELLRVVRSKMREVRKGAQQDPALALKLAEVLAAEPFNPADAKTAILAFSTGPQSISARTSVISEELISMLTPEERKQLAASIRDRAEGKK